MGALVTDAESRGLPWWLSGKNPPDNAEDRLDLWVRKISWSRNWQPTPVFLPGESHGQRSLAGYRAWGRKELETTQWLNTHAGSSFPPGIKPRPLALGMQNLSHWTPGKSSSFSFWFCRFRPLILYIKYLRLRKGFIQDLNSWLVAELNLEHTTLSLIRCPFYLPRLFPTSTCDLSQRLCLWKVLVNLSYLLLTFPPWKSNRKLTDPIWGIATAWDNDPRTHFSMYYFSSRTCYV